MLKAGTSRANITPPIGISHAGWGAQTHQVAEGVDMPLYISALTVTQTDNEDTNNQIVILDIDIGILSPENDSVIRNYISEGTGIPNENIRISYTHTHSGPIEEGGWIVEGAHLIEPWMQSLPIKALEAVQKTYQNMQEVRVDTGRGTSKINVNRRPIGPNGVLFTGRNLNGFVDHEVLVTSIDDLKGNAVATLVNYACHPTIMGPENRMITPDYPGPVRRTVESLVGGICLFLQGAAGNQGPIDGFTGDLSIYRKLGKMLGIEAARVRLLTDPVPREEKLDEIVPSGADLGIYSFPKSGESDDTLSTLTYEALMPIKELPAVEEITKTFDNAKKFLEETRKRTEVLDEIKKAAFPAKRATIHKRLSEIFGTGGTKPVPIQIIRLGNTALVSIPVEPFAEIGYQVKNSSPADWTLFSGYSNGYYGYMPMKENYPEGGYEVDTTPFSPGAAEIMVKECLRALNTIWV